VSLDLDAQTPRRIWHLGADVDTDALAPGAYMQHGIDVVAQHCLETLLPNFSREVTQGDVIVAGPNFGIGSSREQAAQALVHLGVAAVIAPSYSGLFFRNAFNVGLLLLTCPSCEALQNEKCLTLNLRDLQLVLTDQSKFNCEPIPAFLLDMAQAGGLVAMLKKRIQAAV
jgi:3-isopropylmalate/(R)-2-methylmalate dehydratase small subunit